jgi:hypothetical protein
MAVFFTFIGYVMAWSASPPSRSRVGGYPPVFLALAALPLWAAALLPLGWRRRLSC